MANQYKKYVDDESHIVELRRFCCSDSAPSNSESFFLSKCLLILRRHTEIKAVLSYADLDQGHKGIIYQASNFENRGGTGKGRVIEWKGQTYHDHAIRTKYRGRLKPFAAELRQALDRGDAVYRDTKGKIAYLYHLTQRT